MPIYQKMRKIFLKQLLALYEDTDLYEKCKQGGVSLANDFNRKNLALDLLSVLEETRKKKIVSWSRE